MMPVLIKKHVTGLRSIEDGKFSAGKVVRGIFHP
jgi:hypothetical protein